MVTSDREAKVDVSPIVVSEIEVDGVRLVAKEPIRYEVTFVADTSEPFYEIEGPPDILLFAETRELLLDVLVDDLQYLWRTFAVGDQTRITSGAQRVGAELRQLFTRESDAA